MDGPCLSCLLLFLWPSRIKHRLEFGMSGGGRYPLGSAARLKEIFKEVFPNLLEFGDEVIGGAFAEKQLDTGGIEPDAYFGTLFADWDEAVRAMDLRPDDATFLRYMYLRHRQLFEKRKNVFGETVTSEKRIPPRLTPEENLQTVERARRDMELVERGSTTLMPDGRLDWEIETPVKSRRPRPSEVFATPDAPDTDLSRPKLPSDVFGMPEEPTAAAPVISPALEPDASKRSPSVPRRKPLPSDVFGVPDTVPGKAAPNADRESVPREPSSRPTRPMRPDDPFGTPGTPIFREDGEPIIPVPSATGPSSPHTYSMSIRPGETKTQVIELPGLTLELVITMPGLYPRVA